MNFRPDELIFGVEPRILRKGVNDLDWEKPFTATHFARTIGAPRVEVIPVLDAMAEAGYVEPIEGGSYLPTTRFSRLGAASVSNGLARAHADALLLRVCAKAEFINAHAAPHETRIGAIVVFGSYLGDKQHLGDLDLGVQLDIPSLLLWPHSTDPTVRPRYEQQSMNIARTRKALRLRKPETISLHGFDEVLRLRTPYRVIFGKLCDEPFALGSDDSATAPRGRPPSAS